MHIKIIGGGPGQAMLLTAKASQAIKTADIVISNERFSSWLKELNKNFIAANLNETLSLIEEKGRDNKVIAVVVSGDVAYYSFALTLKKTFAKAKLEFINGLNSMQYLMAKLGHDYNELKTISLHGRHKNIIPLLCYNQRLFILTDGINTVTTIIGQLKKAGFKNLEITVGENLGQADEKISSGTLDDLTKHNFSDLAVIHIENFDYVNHWEKIKDHEFERGKVPMTKGEVRAICLNEMAINPQDIIYDIGAGTGSVSITAARMAFEGTVFAIEKNKEALNLTTTNIKKFKAYNVNIVEGEAPKALLGLKKPDKVFIGGSSGNLEDIIKFCLKQNEQASILVTAITVETLTKAVKIFKEIKRPYKVSTINIASSSQAGCHNLMKANNPISLIISRAEEDYGEN